MDFPNFTNVDWLYVGMVLVVVFASMVLHELMHGLTAYWLGDTTAKDDGRLTLNPLKHIDPFMTILLPLLLAIAGMPIFGGAKPVPFRPDRVKGGDWGAALIGIAGPLTNLAIAFVFFAIIVFAKISGTGPLEQFLAVGVMVNLGFFAFNILPIPPLDGSRVLYAIAPAWFRRGMDAVERMGLIAIFVIVMVASPLISAILGAIIQFVLRIFANIFGVAGI
jgi:Zn-dependent protease